MGVKLISFDNKYDSLWEQFKQRCSKNEKIGNKIMEIIKEYVEKKK